MVTSRMEHASEAEPGSSDADIPRPLTRSQGSLLLLAAVLANAAFLHWLWRHWGYWGIWDWDFSASLIEAARRSIVDFHQLPLWNPWLGGGGSLAGHPLASTFSPSFLLPLVFGTVAGMKLTVLAYLSVAQVGAFRLTRRLGVDTPAAILAALLFAWGGVFAQHLAHGHIAWIGYAWVPFVLVAVLDSRRALRFAPLAVGSIFLAFTWLDGSIYHYVIIPLFVALYAGCLALQGRGLRPVLAAGVIGAGGFALAAIEILPVAEMVFEFPRRAGPNNHYYGATFQPTALELLHQAFLSRQQAHSPDAWMPFVINVGTYVGAVPLLLAAFGLVRRPGDVWPWALCFAVMLLICLGNATPVDPWRGLRLLPGLDSMQIPMRWRIVPLLCLAPMAAFGLQALHDLVRRHLDPKQAVAVAAAIAAGVGLDLFWVNAPIFEAAYVVPPIETTREPFHHVARSPYREVYEQTAERPIWKNWPTASFPTIRENRGVLLEFWPMVWPRLAAPFDRADHPGGEVVALKPGSEVTAFAWTPNRITASTRGSGGKIVINQNFRSGWEVRGDDSARITSERGVLAVQIGPGERHFEVVYRPRTFQVAAATSLASWLGLGAFAGLRRRSATPHAG